MYNMTKLRDVVTLLSPAGQMIPKKITLDLSENGKFYHTRMYVDIASHGEMHEGYIYCKTSSHINSNGVFDLDLMFDYGNHEEKVFTVTIPEGVYRHEKMP